MTETLNRLAYLSNAAAALTASATAQNSKRVLRAHAQWSTRAFIYYGATFT